MEAYPNVIDPGTRDVGTQSIEALKLYDEGDYEAAIVSFDDYLHVNPDDMEARFYYGISAMMSERPQIAEKELLTVAKGDSRLKNQARWYLSLNFIKEEKIDEARENLQLLIEGDSSYGKKAKELMRKL